VFTGCALSVFATTSADLGSDNWSNTFSSMPVSSSFDLIGAMSIPYSSSKLSFTSGNFFMMFPPSYFFLLYRPNFDFYTLHFSLSAQNES
jgi:hypothetical protein